MTKREEARLIDALERIAKECENQNRLSVKFYNDQREYMELQTKWTNFLLGVNGVE